MVFAENVKISMDIYAYFYVGLYIKKFIMYICGLNT